jgi:hypothetical protein
MTIDFKKLLDDISSTRQMVQTLLDHLSQQPSGESTPAQEKPLNVHQAASFLKVSPQTVYQNIGKIPHRKRHGRLYFYENELAAYLDGDL